MVEKLISLVNQTREDKNVNDLHVSPYLDLASDTNTSKDIPNNVLIMFDSPIPFGHPCEFEKGEMSEDEVSICVDQFDRWYISDGGESCE